MIFPLADATVPFADIVSRVADDWLLGKGGLFWAEGNSWLMLMGKLLIGWLGIRVGVEILSGGTGEGQIPNAVYRLGRWVIVLWLMQYYNTPNSLFGGQSFHKLIPEEARQLLVIANDDSLRTALQTVNDLEKKADKETDWWSPSQNMADTFLGWMVAGFQGVMILLSCGGYVLLAIAVTVGPLSIPWLTFDSTAWLFWDWLQVMISASMFQVIGAVLVNLWSNVIVQAANYMLPLDLMRMSLLFGAINIAMFLSALGIAWITTALYGKGASSAANMVSGAVSTVTRAAGSF